MLPEGSTAYDAIGYKEMLACVKGEESLDTAAEKIKLATRHYAKRQLTWFNKNKDITWLYPDDYTSKQELLRSALDVIEKNG
jgi:tRNA dimethylallyltransferase